MSPSPDVSSVRIFESKISKVFMSLDTKERPVIPVVAAELRRCSTAGPAPSSPRLAQHQLLGRQPPECHHAANLHSTCQQRLQPFANSLCGHTPCCPNQPSRRHRGRWRGWWRCARHMVEPVRCSSVKSMPPAAGDRSSLVPLSHLVGVGFQRHGGRERMADERDQIGQRSPGCVVAAATSRTCEASMAA